MEDVSHCIQSSAVIHASDADSFRWSPRCLTNLIVRAIVAFDSATTAAEHSRSQMNVSDEDAMLKVQV